MISFGRLPATYKLQYCMYGVCASDCDTVMPYVVTDIRTTHRVSTYIRLYMICMLHVFWGIITYIYRSETKSIDPRNGEKEIQKNKKIQGDTCEVTGMEE